MKRLQFLRSLLGLPALPAALAQAKAAEKTQKVYLYYGFVRGFRYGDGYEVLDKLVPGVALQLVREPENRYDPQAIRVEAFGRKLGYLPRESNRTLSLMLDAGHKLYAEVSHVNDEADDWQVLRLGVYEWKAASQPLPVGALLAVPEPVYDGSYIENKYTPVPDPYADYGRWRRKPAQEPLRPNRRWPAGPGNDLPDAGPPIRIVVDKRALPPGLSLEQALTKCDQAAQSLLDGVEGAEHLIVLQTDKLHHLVDSMQGSVRLIDKLGNRMVARLLG